MKSTACEVVAKCFFLLPIFFFCIVNTIHFDETVFFLSNRSFNLVISFVHSNNFILRDFIYAVIINKKKKLQLQYDHHILSPNDLLFMKWMPIGYRRCAEENWWNIRYFSTTTHKKPYHLFIARPYIQWTTVQAH